MKNPERIEALGRVKEWTRGRFTLPTTATILVSEMACSLPGCPPLETHVLFLTPDGVQAGDGSHHGRPPLRLAEGCARPSRRRRLRLLLTPAAARFGNIDSPWREADHFRPPAATYSTGESS